MRFDKPKDACLLDLDRTEGARHIRTSNLYSICYAVRSERSDVVRRAWKFILMLVMLFAVLVLSGCLGGGKAMDIGDSH